MPEELTTKQAAKILNITPRRVLALIHSGRLPAEKHGRHWAIKPEDLELVKVQKSGRPFRPQPAFRDKGTIAIMISRRPSGDESGS